MAVFRAGWVVPFAIAMALLPPARALAGGQCHVVDVDFMPAEIADMDPMRSPSQIVAWVETPTETFVDTVFITQQTGTYGLGNRPGRFDFNSGPAWPYGRRTTVFPVWSHRRAAAGKPTFPEVVFQNGDDDNLSHPFNQSSRDIHFCRPLQRSEPGWDATTCASTVFTDKGILGSRTSLYPPRADIERTAADHPSVDMFAMLNPFDAVSQATPASGVPAQISWPIPPELPVGDYVLWVEVAREFDHNATYSSTAYPAPTGIPWSDYGEAYRGQPSVVYKVAFSISTSETVATTLDYAGYGDPDGMDGDVRVPDNTISTGVAGSGAERLAVNPGATPYRVRVTARPEFDFARPDAAADPFVANLTSSSATIEFIAPGDDGLVGKVKGFEIRYIANGELTEENFDLATDPKPSLTIAEPGTPMSFELAGLLYDTSYTVGIRAFDDCHNKGPITTVAVTTLERAVGEVDACFIATAAYGSLMANDVEMLRRFRDIVVGKTVIGELAVEAYYTFGPAISGVVGESELLRATARAVLDPIVSTVRVFKL